MDTPLPPTWFGPLSPLPPVAPPGVAGRQFDYLTGWNLQVLPRAEAAASPAELRALADSCDLVRLAIETRKDQLTDLQWTIAVRGGGSDARVGQATALLARPDREHAWDEWVRMLVEDMLVLDAATLYPRQALDGSLIALEPLDGGTIKRVLDDDGRTPVPPLPAYQQILKGLPAVDYTADALLYLPRNPRTWRVYGLSPVEQCLLTINIALRRQMHKLEYYTEGSMPDAFLGVPEDWTTEQLKEYQAYWDGLLSGNTAERRHLRFIHGNVRYVETKPAILKDDFDEWLARIVAFAFSISPAPFVRQMNRATAESQDAQALREGMAPLMRWLKRVVDEVLARTMGWPDLELVWRDTTEQDPQKQAEIATSLVAAGIQTRNEARAALGLSPLPDGDALTVAGPVTPLARLLDGGAEAFGKAGFNPDEPRDERGRWTTGAADALVNRFAADDTKADIRATTISGLRRHALYTPLSSGPVQVAQAEPAPEPVEGEPLSQQPPEEEPAPEAPSPIRPSRPAPAARRDPLNEFYDPANPADRARVYEDIRREIARLDPADPRGAPVLVAPGWVPNEQDVADIAEALRDVRQRLAARPETPEPPSSVWGLGWGARGLEIETGRDRTGAMGPGFPTIDRFPNGIAISTKSIDLRAPTYQNPARLESKLETYVDILSGF